jgi:hypothetical protein
MPTEGVQELVGVEFLEGCVTWVTSFNVLQLYSGMLGHLLQSLLDQPTPTNVTVLQLYSGMLGYLLQS